MSDEQKSTEKPPYGPGIVRGWFDGVLNPLIAGLSLLQIYLRRGLLHLECGDQ
jgi:vacuolar-type H+-ATPase catalytic subunit A/Vma1